MRKIGLYRGKRKSDNMWVFGSLLKRADAEKPGEFFYMISDLCGINDEVIPETIGEFIGFSDKNDREIFEGDIVLLDNWEPDHAIVTFDRGGFCFYFKPHDNYYHDCKYLEGQVVIGNIHDEAKP
jgi:hypothetical protein